MPDRLSLSQSTTTRGRSRVIVFAYAYSHPPSIFEMARSAPSVLPYPRKKAKAAPNPKKMSSLFFDGITSPPVHTMDANLGGFQTEFTHGSYLDQRLFPGFGRISLFTDSAKDTLTYACIPEPAFMSKALYKRLGGHIKYFKQYQMRQLMMARRSQLRLLPHI